MRKHLILPGDDILIADLAEFSLPEVRKKLGSDNVFLTVPCVFLEPRSQILLIKLHECLKAHVHIRRTLQLEHSLPFLGFSLRCKASFAFLFSFTRPVHIACHDIPGALVFVLEYRHYLPPFLIP